MNGEFIELTASDGGSFKGYLSLPETGQGPGMVVIQEIFGVNSHVRDVADAYAEEGYVVLAPDLFWRMEPGVELGYGEEDFQKAFGFYQKLDVDRCVQDIGDAIAALRSLPQLAGKVGCIGFCLGGKLAYLTAARTDVDCAVGYYGVAIEDSLDEADNITCPLVLHFASEDQFVPAAAVQQIYATLEGKPGVELFTYPGMDHAFNCPERPSYNRPAAMMAHSRSMAMFRRTLGPIYDLNARWEQHLEYEFAVRDADQTLATMVDEPYVNHIPTMTGGVGKKHLRRFYQHHFIHANPEDTEMIPISRTIGADRIVDELLFRFTHTKEIDWMLPGIPPTGKRVEIPLVAIVNFRGNKLCHEHIYWDQASVLVQLGLLDPAQYPVAGRETAQKLLDESLPSNTLMRRWADSEPG